MFEALNVQTRQTLGMVLPPVKVFVKQPLGGGAVLSLGSALFVHSVPQT
jgi:hypothetical protein